VRLRASRGGETGWTVAAEVIDQRGRRKPGRGFPKHLRVRRSVETGGMAAAEVAGPDARGVSSDARRTEGAGPSSSWVVNTVLEAIASHPRMACRRVVDRRRQVPDPYRDWSRAGAAHREPASPPAMCVFGRVSTGVRGRVASRIGQRLVTPVRARTFAPGYRSRDRSCRSAGRASKADGKPSGEPPVDGA